MTGCKGIAGLRAVYIIARRDILYQVEDSAGNVVNFGLAPGKKFFKYELQRDTAEFSENVKPSRATEQTIVEQELRLVLNSRVPSVRAEMMAIAHNTVSIIAEDRRGTMWLLGRDLGLDVDIIKGTSGKVAGDRYGFELTFKGWELALAPAFIFNSSACPAGPWGPEFSIQFPGGSQAGGCGGSFDDIFSYEFLGGGYPASVGDFASSDFASTDF